MECYQIDAPKQAEGVLTLATEGIAICWKIRSFGYLLFLAWSAPAHAGLGEEKEAAAELVRSLAKVCERYNRPAINTLTRRSGALIVRLHPERT
jgi:hypothetical protein